MIDTLPQSQPAIRPVSAAISSLGLLPQITSPAPSTAALSNGASPFSVNTAVNHPFHLNSFVGQSTGGGTSISSFTQNDVPSVRYMVGIDFGTTFTGFAIYRVPHGQKPANIDSIAIVGKEDWRDQPNGVFSQKAPTVIAYDRLDRTQKLWGWSVKKQAKEYHDKIERVKLALESSTPPAMKPWLPDDLTAEDIIADYLALIRQEMLGIISQSYPMDANRLVQNDFLFCFTVPVGWSHQAHQSLRRAATRAQLIIDENSKHLIFCYEPEAAALACVHESDFDIEPDSSMLVVDCGGGTVDLFLCKLGKDKDMEELTVGDGNFLGATRIDSNFWNFMRENIGIGAFDQFKTNVEFRRAYTEMEWKWEYLKRQYTGKLTNYEVFQLPQALLRIMNAEKVDNLDMGEIHVYDENMRDFFDPVVNEIIALVRKQLVAARDSGILKVKYLYVVGGFGCNKYLQERITCDPFVRDQIQFSVSPRRPEAAVLRGAVWAAINHHAIKSRKARKTIGVGILRLFQYELDDPQEIVAYDPENPNDISKAYVPKSVFVFVSKGQSVSASARFTRSGFRVRNVDQQLINVNVYATDQAPGSSRIETSECDLLGTITIQLPKWSGYGVPPTFTIEIGYGRVELTVRIIDQNTGHEWNQFLNHGHFEYASIHAPKFVEPHPREPANMEYNRLADLLADLSQHRTHQVMIPFDKCELINSNVDFSTLRETTRAPLAYVLGNIIHCNDVRIALGNDPKAQGTENDVWFADVSSRAARAIALHRATNASTEEPSMDLHASADVQEPTLPANEDELPIHDIVEPFDEASERPKVGIEPDMKSVQEKIDALQVSVRSGTLRMSQQDIEFLDRAFADVEEESDQDAQAAPAPQPTSRTPPGSGILKKEKSRKHANHVRFNVAETPESSPARSPVREFEDPVADQVIERNAPDSLQPDCPEDLDGSGNSDGSQDSEGSNDGEESSDELQDVDFEMGRRELLEAYHKSRQRLVTRMIMSEEDQVESEEARFNRAFIGKIDDKDWKQVAEEDLIMPQRPL